VVSWLLAQGVDPNIRDLKEQATALELAIQGGCFQAATILKCVLLLLRGAGVIFWGELGGRCY